MYHGKKKFTFDDPEDSYWNESGNGSTASSLFDDLPSKQWAARIAVDNLFDTKDNTQPPPLTHPTTTAPQTQQAAAADRTQINFASAPPLSREKLVDNFLHSRAAAGRGVSGMSMSPERALPGAPSVTSECSASSLPSEAQRLDLDYSRLRAEHRKLQKHLETVRHERFRPLNVKETIRRLMRGDPVSLDLYRTKAEKMELLDSAIDHVDSQVIQPVVLFLKRTLSDSIFRSILLEKKEVAEEYITHLKRHKDYAELATTLFCLGRNADAAMIEYAAALKTKMPEQKVNALRNVCRTAFSDPQLAHEAGLVSQHASLLEMQIAIQAGDAQSKSDIFKQFPRNAPLVGQSAIATLYYCSLYHYDLPMTSQANPQKIRDFLGISEKEFRWTAASALTRQSRWPDIERLLQPKGVMGAIQQKALQANTKLVCPFSWNNLFYVLHSNTSLPPKDLLCRILRSVSDQELRLKLAEKYQVPEVVIECLVAQRDRVRLKIYTDKLTPHTPDYYKSIAALNNAMHLSLFICVFISLFASNHAAKISGKHAVAVTGELKCGTKAAAGSYIRLFRVKPASPSKEDPNQMLDEEKSDGIGKFLVEGNTNGFPVAELEMNSPVISIYHSCDLSPEEVKKSGYRKFSYSIPKDFVAAGAKAKRTFDIGNINLQIKYPEESRDKNFKPQE